MKFVCAVAVSVFLLAAPVMADDKPPSAESVKELLTLSEAQDLLKDVKARIDPMMAQARARLQQGVTMTPERQAILVHMRERMAAVVDDQISWSVLEPIYIRTYQASFTQSELDGLIAFYKTPAGRALVKKMPLVMQNLMGEMQGMMTPMLQKMQQIQTETKQELDALPGK